MSGEQSLRFVMRVNGLTGEIEFIKIQPPHPTTKDRMKVVPV